MVPDLAVSLIATVVFAITFIVLPFMKWYSVVQAQAQPQPPSKTAEALYSEANDARDFFFGWLALAFMIGMCDKTGRKITRKIFINALFCVFFSGFMVCRHNQILTFQNHEG